MAGQQRSWAGPRSGPQARDRPHGSRRCPPASHQHGGTDLQCQGLGGGNDREKDNTWKSLTSYTSTRLSQCRAGAERWNLYRAVEERCQNYLQNSESMIQSENAGLKPKANPGQLMGRSLCLPRCRAGELFHELSDSSRPLCWVCWPGALGFACISRMRAKSQRGPLQTQRPPAPLRGFRSRRLYPSNEPAGRPAPPPPKTADVGSFHAQQNEPSNNWSTGGCARLHRQ